jgi:predicted nucleic acid-binding protein
MARVRTNIELEDRYIETIKARYGVRTKTEAVDLALRNLAGQPMTREVTPRGMVDCMIAAVAQRRGLALLAWDVDMFRLAEVVGLELDGASLRAE